MHRLAWPDVRVACVWIAQLPLRVEILRHAAWDGQPLLRPRLGFANGKFAAAVAARMAEPGVARSRVVPASETRAFLAPLPVRHLLMLDADAVQRLEVLGLRTIGDLAALPFSAVQAQ